MKSLKLKQSQGHVEMILSFAIFAGFVVVMLFLLNPAKENKISYGSLDVAENIILDNISITYDSIAVILDAPINNGLCFSVENNLNLLGRSLAIDEKKNIVFSGNTPSKINIQPNNNVRLYKLYFSDSFNSYYLATNCAPPSTGYSFGVLIHESSVLWENIQALNKSYMEDYSKLKRDLNINEDFEFVVYNLNRSQVLFDTTSVHKLKTSFVLSRDLPLRIIDKNATQRDIVLNLRVW
jgi:hypothetical protein